MFVWGGDPQCAVQTSQKNSIVMSVPVAENEIYERKQSMQLLAHLM